MVGKQPLSTGITPPPQIAIDRKAEACGSSSSRKSVTLNLKIEGK
jgi:hypothetical protein